MKKNNMTKKATMMILCAATVMNLAACGGTNEDKTIGAETKQTTDAAETVMTIEQVLGGDDVQIPNPFVDCDTLNDAANVAGFDIIVPDSIDGYEERSITALENDMIQVQYLHGDDQISIRKAAGEEDCSGDYNEYAESTVVTVGDREVTLKGNNGQVMLAVWTEGGYSYAVGVYTYTQHNDGVADPESATGVTEETMTAWIAQVQ